MIQSHKIVKKIHEIHGWLPWKFPSKSRWKKIIEFLRVPGLVNVYSLLLKMAIEIVDFPIKHGDVPC